MRLKKFAALAAVLGAGAWLIFLPTVAAQASFEESPQLSEVDGVEYSTAEEAIAAWETGSVLELKSDLFVPSTVTVAGEKELRLNGHALSLAEGDGSVLELKSGPLTVIGPGEIKGGNSTLGGGIYVGDRLLLRDNVVISENEGSNLYVTSGSVLDATGFTGRAGVTMSATTGKFASGGTQGDFFADDPLYHTRIDGEEWLVELCPLGSVTAVYEQGDTVVYPTSDLDIFRSGLTLSGLNENGVAYPEAIEEYTLSTPSGKLSVGECEVTVTVAVGDASLTATFTATVRKPRLLTLEAEFRQTDNVYFDTPFLSLVPCLSVTGMFEDGNPRAVFPTAAETAAQCGEEYIDAAYEIAGDLNSRKDGVATMYVKSGDVVAPFEVRISKYVIDITHVEVYDVTKVEQDRLVVSTDEFVKNVPQGIEVAVSCGGEPFAAEGLTPGVYHLEIAFRVVDSLNFEEISGVREATFTLNRGKFEKTVNGETAFVFTREGGLPPAWEFAAKDVTEEISPRLGSKLKMRQACEITLFKGESSGENGAVTVRLLLSKSLRGKEGDGLRLFRLGADGATEEVSFERDGDYLVFEGDDLIEAQYVVASDSGFATYVALTVVFGTLCVAGAGVLLWYFIRRRNLRLK